MPMARFSVDSERVVHEAIDGETLAVQLVTGAYYSLRGTAHEAWELLVAGQPLDSVAAELARRYPEAPDAVDDVHRFAAELIAEQLLVEFAAAPPPLPGDHAPSERTLAVYVAPRAERYDDMQYFLRLDPIHEVDEVAGWPQPAATGEVAG
jgi:coenzyme PQQ synthesis protein D (PqqD)